MKFFAILFATVLLLLTITSSKAQQSDITLVGHWAFDELQGITANDSSGYNNNGTCYGPLWSDGNINGCLSFNGLSDYVLVPNNSSLNPTSEITLCAWINRSSYTFGNRRILQKGNNDSQYLLVASANQDRLEFRVRGLSNDFLTGPIPLPTSNKWYHVAGTYDGSEMKLYCSVDN